MQEKQHLPGVQGNAMWKGSGCKTLSGLEWAIIFFPIEMSVSIALECHHTNTEELHSC